jgi:hypothetical protein
MSGVKVDLKHPIEIAGAKVAVISLRRPKVKDMLAAEKAGGSDAEKEIRIFANLAEQPPEVIESLDLADYAALQRAYQGFLS